MTVYGSALVACTFPTKKSQLDLSGLLLNCLGSFKRSSYIKCSGETCSVFPLYAPLPTYLMRAMFSVLSVLQNYIVVVCFPH